MTREMISGSDRAVTHIEIYDSEVQVWVRPFRVSSSISSDSSHELGTSKQRRLVSSVAAAPATLEWNQGCHHGDVSWLEASVSIGTGILLWMFLPRGVVLTRAVRMYDSAGELLDDTWGLKNDSPLPVRLTSVRVIMPGYEGELGPDGHELVWLTFDDETTEIAREDGRTPWSKTVILPGDTLTAAISNNTTLRIQYRRAGWSGVFERRRLEIHGAV